MWAAQNGEIYNFPDLHRQLVKRGHVFNSHCDTEILPHLYEEYREDLVQHIDGMFAFAIWDREGKHWDPRSRSNGEEALILSPKREGSLFCLRNKVTPHHPRVRTSTQSRSPSSFFKL